LEGYLTIELPDQIISLEVGDMFIIQPDIEHLSKADYAKLFVVCNPPFHPDNLIFS
jgi:quercetin dioxygenase-like cupin family protein